MCVSRGEKRTYNNTPKTPPPRSSAIAAVGVPLVGGPPPIQAEWKTEAERERAREREGASARRPEGDGGDSSRPAAAGRLERRARASPPRRLRAPPSERTAAAVRLVVPSRTVCSCALIFCTRVRPLVRRRRHARVRFCSSGGVVRLCVFVVVVVRHAFSRRGRISVSPRTHGASSS